MKCVKSHLQVALLGGACLLASAWSCGHLVIHLPVLQSLLPHRPPHDGLHMCTHITSHTHHTTPHIHHTTHKHHTTRHPSHHITHIHHNHTYTFTTTTQHTHCFHIHGQQLRLRYLFRQLLCVRFLPLYSTQLPVHSFLQLFHLSLSLSVSLSLSLSLSLRFGLLALFSYTYKISFKCQQESVREGSLRLYKHEKYLIINKINNWEAGEKILQIN